MVKAPAWGVSEYPSCREFVRRGLAAGMPWPAKIGRTENLAGIHLVNWFRLEDMGTV